MFYKFKYFIFTNKVKTDRKGIIFLRILHLQSQSKLVYITTTKKLHLNFLKFKL